MMDDKVAHAVDWLKNATDKIRALASGEARSLGNAPASAWLWLEALPEGSRMSV